MFTTFPGIYSQTEDWTWAEYETYVNDLQMRELTKDNIEAWLTDWTRLGEMLWERRARLQVAITQDTTDEDAEARYKQYMTDIFPKMLTAFNQLDRKLAESGIIPENFEIPMRGIRASIELYRDENVELLRREDELGKQYNKITGAHTVEWDGEETTLKQLGKVYHENDRERREAAWHKAAERQLQDREALNDLWRELMDVRRQIFMNAGLSDYRAYAWMDRGRFDYTPEDALEFCDAILQTVVPAAEKLHAERREGLGLEALRPWDLQVDPQNRPPMKPYQTIDEFELRTEAIFRRVNPELGTYFKTMRDENLLDLGNRKGKAPGGYCTTFALTKQPFIFMNAVGLDTDIRTLLHEAGHAFHAIEASQLPYLHQRRAPMEFNEVASMAMELLAAPYIKSDYGGYYDEADYVRSRVSHLKRIIKFWPYMAVVVAFQHWVYTNHNLATDPAACDEKWQELYLKYVPGVDYDGLDDWVKTGWQRKLHIFRLPFYYIEYGLAQLGAVQVWGRALQNSEAALHDYMQALKLGGTVTLPELYNTAGVKLAFDAETLGVAVELIEQTIGKLEGAAQ